LNFSRPAFSPEGGHDVQQGGAVLCDLSREAPERGAVLSVAVGSHRIRWASEASGRWS
jgi:hypothetical protein